MSHVSRSLLARPLVFRYGAAVLTSALALLVILLLNGLPGRPSTLAPYLAAVMFSSWYGGLGPGFLF